MKDLPRVPGTKMLCPEECRYRGKLVPFCGYCLPEVMKKLGIDRRKEKNDGREEENIGLYRPG